MTEIPQDIWDAADQAHYKGYLSKDSRVQVDHIAKAILGERERCADILEVVKRYLVAIDSSPEKDIWDTWDGKPQEGALKTASDASWDDHGQKIDEALFELRNVIVKSGCTTCQK